MVSTSKNGSNQSSKKDSMYVPQVRSRTSVVSRIESEIEYEQKLMKWSKNVDRRYAWVVLFSLFTMMATTLGSYRIFGLIFAQIVKEEVYTREEASWPVATIFTTENCVGPLVSIIVYYFSFRQSLFLGSLFLIAGNGLTYFSNTIVLDILLLGVVQGLGYGFIFMPMMEIVNSYFVAYRAIALGVALTGGTAAIFVLIPIFTYILENYPFRMAYAAIGAICCINLVMVPLLRPNPRPRQPREDNGEQETQLKRNKLIRMSSHAFRFHTSMRRQSSIKMILPERTSVVSMNPQPTTVGQVKRADILIQSNSCPVGFKGTLGQPKKLKLQQENSFESRNSIATVDMPGDLSDTHSDDDFKLSMFLDVLKNPAFHLIWYNELVFFWVFSIYCLVAVDYAVDRGLTQSEAHSLLQYWSCGEIVGRLFLTVLVDMKFVSNKVIVMIDLLGLGLVMILVTMVSGFVWYASITICVAALNSLLYILINGLLVDYLGEQHVTLGYGMASCIDGILMSFRPTALGYFRDYLGSYDYAMIAMACMCLLGVVFWIFEPLYAKKKTSFS